MEKPSKYFMRFAITPLCNFRCVYCNPSKSKENKNVVDEDEIIKIAQAGRRVGLNRFHYTGGEPTLMDMHKLVTALKEIGYINQILTTNGSQGGDYLEELAELGLRRVIVSLDSLDPERFQKITRTNYFNNVLDTIKRGIKIFEDPTKMNIVYMEETKKEISHLLEFGREINQQKGNKGKLIVKFIEMSKNNPVFYEDQGTELYDNSHSDGKELMRILSTYDALKPIKRVVGNNYYHLAEGNFDIGIILIPTWEYKCGGDACTKIRLNPYADIAVCIQQKPISIKDKSEDEIVETLEYLIDYKTNIDKHMPSRKHYRAQYGFWRFGDCNSTNNQQTHS